VGKRRGAHIRSQLQVRDTTLDVLLVWVIKMTIYDLLGEGKGSV
jgi:hypothetical protein